MTPRMGPCEPSKVTNRVALRDIENRVRPLSCILASLNLHAQCGGPNDGAPGEMEPLATLGVAAPSAGLDLPRAATAMPPAAATAMMAMIAIVFE